MSRPAIQSLSVPLFSLAMAIACSSTVDDQGSTAGAGQLAPSNTTITAEGSGPTNSAPLEAVTVGSRQNFADGMSRVVAGKDEAGVLRIEWSDGSVNLWRSTSQGWEMAGVEPNVLEEAILMVPHEARVGMQWTGGGYDFEVISREERDDTPFGPGIVWAIERNRGGSLDKTRYYIEGRGLWYDEGGVNPRTLESAIVPLDDRHPAESAVQAQELRPLLNSEGEPWVLDFEGTPFLTLTDAAGRTHISLDGSKWVVQNPDGLGPSWELLPHGGCLTLDGGELQEADLTSSLERDWSQSTCPSFPGELLSSPEGILRVQPLAAPKSAGGEVEFRRNESVLAITYDAEAGDDGESLAIGQGYADLFLTPWSELDPAGGDPTTARERYRDRRGALPSYGHVFGRPEHWMSTGKLLEGLHPLTVWMSNGVLAGTGLDREAGDMVPASPLWFAGYERLPAIAPDEHRYLLPRGGVIDEVAIDDKGRPQLERLARVRLPEQHFLNGAAPLDRERLLVVTSSRTLGADGEPFAPPTEFVDSRVSWLWEVDVTREELTPPPALSYRAFSFGGDVIVCGPDTQLEPDQWTIKGATAKTLLRGSESSCVALVPDFDDPDLDRASRAVLGELPEVGKVAIALAPEAAALNLDNGNGTSTAYTDLWPTAENGGFAGGGRQFDALGVEVSTGADRLFQDEAMPDSQGLGAWILATPWDVRIDLVQAYGKTVESEQTWPGNGSNGKGQVSLLGPIHRDAGGGVLVATGFGTLVEYHLLTADGGVSTLPKSRLPNLGNSSFGRAAVHADGTIYGEVNYNNGKALACSPPAGEVEVYLDIPQGLMSPKFFPIEKGLFLIASGDAQLHIFDPTEGSLSLVAEDLGGRFVWDAFSTDADGAPQLWLLSLGEGSTRGRTDTPGPENWPFRITAEGPVELPGRLSAPEKEEYVVNLIPTPEFLLLIHADGSISRVAR